MGRARRLLCVGVSAVLALSGYAATARGAASPIRGLDSLLPRAGEMPGFKASSRVFEYPTIAADVANDPAVIRKADRANLVRDGFVVELAENEIGTGNQHGSSARYGVSGVTRLGSHAAAQAYADFSFGLLSKPGSFAGTRQQVRFVDFRVPGVPGAEGVATISRSKAVAHANLQWVEGSCVVQIGDGVGSKTPDTRALIAASESIFKRTSTTCRP